MAKTSTKTATKTSTSTDAYTKGNVTVTGGAGAGDTTVRINPASSKDKKAIAAAKKRVEKKAGEWNQRNPKKAKVQRIPDPLEAIEIGEIVSICYRSAKFDGKVRVWEHVVTKKRKLYISLDGSILVVKPGFKITKRGIEG